MHNNEVIMHKAKTSDNDFLTTAPAARELGVASQTVIEWERQGKLPAIKTSGGVRLFRREDIEVLKKKRQAEQVLNERIPR